MQAFVRWFNRRITYAFAAVAVIAGIGAAGNAAESPAYVTSADPITVGVGAALVVFIALMACRVVALCIRVVLYLSTLNSTLAEDTRQVIAAYRRSREEQ